MKDIKQHRFSFPKEERIAGVKEVDLLFSNNKGFFAYPCKVLFNINSTDCENERIRLKVLFSVSKRYSKRAVKRNLIKRRLREAFRLNKHLFYDNINISDSDSDSNKAVQGVVISIAFLYIAKDEQKYSSIEHCVKKVLQHITKEFKKSCDSNTSDIN